MALNDKEYHVIMAKIMFKTDYKLAISWLKSKGFEVSQADYYRILARLDSEAQKRLYEVGAKFQVIAADELVKLSSIEKMLFEEYHKETKPKDRAIILKMIVELQPYLTSLYDQTRLLIEGKVAKEINNLLPEFTEPTTIKQ